MFWWSSLNNSLHRICPESGYAGSLAGTYNLYYRASAYFQPTIYEGICAIENSSDLLMDLKIEYMALYAYFKFEISE